MLRNPRLQVSAYWPGPEPCPGDKSRLQKALRHHGSTHTVQDALSSMIKIHTMMQQLDEQRLIPDKNALQIYLQHCCAKSASFEAETVCFEAATLALDMIEKHGCSFDASVIKDIAMQISLRAEMCNVEDFV